MKVIKIQHPQINNRTDMPPLVMALGYFDGVHLGHQEVIKTAVSIAKRDGLKSAVMTFDPHPSVVLGRSIQHVQYITPLEDKVNEIAKLGIDYIYVVHFSLEFSSLLPQQFIDDYIISLNVKHVVAGFDYSYGKLGKGTMETLTFHSREKFTHTVVPKLAQGEEKISSTLIRSYITEGMFERLPQLIGRYYSTSGTVIHGDKRGRTIGFPTANIDIGTEYLYPPVGVYAVQIKVAEQWYEGVCNVGYKPTFHKEQAKYPSVEVHIFQFSDDIYGQYVTIEWHKRIRNEKKFSGIPELVDQIHKDAEKAKHYFKGICP